MKSSRVILLVLMLLALAAAGMAQQQLMGVLPDDGEGGGSGGGYTCSGSCDGHPVASWTCSGGKQCKLNCTTIPGKGECE
jgi:hypothetical protein